MEQRTHCPEIEVLEKYLRGRLQEQEAGVFSKHLEVCGLCSVVVERLRDLDAAMAAVSAEPEPDWGLMERRIEEECKKLRATAPKVVKSAGWASGGLWIPALGYGLALALVYPAWLGITRKPVPSLATPAAPEARGVVATPASFVDLNATRDLQGLPKVTERAGEAAAVLSFFVPSTAGVRHTASILDSADKVVLDLGEITSHDGNGNFCVVVDPRSLPVGRYRLTVRENGSLGERATSFEFVRE